MLGRFGGAKNTVRAFFSNKAAGGLLTVLLIAILVMEFGSLLILSVERGAPGANIESAQDALWYLIVTMSTVGYGDRFPVTDVGRLVGSFIIVVGVGVFGTLTGFLANVFMAPSRPVEAAAPEDGTVEAGDTGAVARPVVEASTSAGAG
jgi:voltage-gated potassium channel